jgi:soluble lytic murein transglycosylase-like protein
MAMVAGLWIAPVPAQIYGGRTADDTVVLSNFRSNDTPTLVISATAAASAGDTAGKSGPFRTTRMPAQLIRSIVDDVAGEVEVPVRLLHAVISVESDYDANAVSPKGAQGLMQLMPATARRFGVEDPFDPRENVRGGALYLKWLLDLFGGDLHLAIAAYNAGEQAVIKAGYRIPPYSETQKYVPRVMSRLQRAVQG